MTELAGTGKYLSRDELRLWTSFLDASRMLDAALAADLSTSHDMSHREYEILVRLDGAGGSLRMSDLARQIVASAPLITQTVHRLEQRGWVERRPSSVDSRGVEAMLTPAGTSALAAASGPHAALVKILLTDIVDEGRLPVAAEAIGEVADHLRAHRRGEPCERDGCRLGPDGLPS